METPNYAKLKNLFEDLMKKKGWLPIDWNFDWLRILFAKHQNSSNHNATIIKNQDFPKQTPQKLQEEQTHEYNNNIKLMTAAAASTPVSNPNLLENAKSSHTVKERLKEAFHLTSHKKINTNLMDSQANSNVNSNSQTSNELKSVHHTHNQFYTYCNNMLKQNA